MASNELISLAAKAMEDRRKDLIAQPLSRIYPQLAEAAAGAILAALQEPTEAMEFAVDPDDCPTPDAAVYTWRAMLNASPLGEQSE